MAIVSYHRFIIILILCRRVDSLSSQASLVRSDLERYFSSNRRNALFGPRYYSNRGLEHRNVSSVDRNLNEQRSLVDSIRSVEGMSAAAAATLDSLRSQRSRLKVGLLLLFIILTCEECS